MKLLCNKAIRSEDERKMIMPLKVIGKVIGNKAKFAIEYKITRFYDNFMYGNFYYWINNEMIGAPEDFITLNDVMVLLPELVRYNGNRDHDTFFKQCKYEVIEFFYEKLCSDLYSKITEDLIESFVPARFCLDLDIEEFYDFKVILIESENQARIIYSKNNIVNDLYVEKGYVDRIIYQAYKELNCIYDSFEQSVYR